MKKVFFTIVSIFSCAILFAQDIPEDNKQSKIGLTLLAKLGTGTLVQNNSVNLQGNSNSADFLISYQFNEAMSLSTGLGLIDFKTNGVTSGESYSLSQEYLRIPLYFKQSLSLFKNNFDNKIVGYVGVGLYGNTLLKENIQTISGDFEKKNQGWNFGATFQGGISFNVSKYVNLGVGLETQQDLTKMKKNGVERRLESLTQFMFSFDLKF